MNLKSKQSLTLLLLLSCTLLLSACGTSSKSAVSKDTIPTGKDSSVTDDKSPRVLTDALGHEVEVPSQPKRIIATYLEDHLVALGVKPVAQWSIGKGSVQNYLQKELKDIPTISFDLPFEAVMSFQPDLLIMGSADTVADDKYTKYAQIAPTYTVGKEKNNDWRQVLQTIGDVLGKSEEAKQVLSNYEHKANQAKEKLKKAVGTQSAAAVWVTAKSIYLVSENLSSGDVLYQDLGLTVPKVVEEASKTGKDNWNSISMEKFAQLDADYLFIVNSRGISMDEILKDPVWANIPAVKKGQIYEFNDDSSWLYSGSIANSQMIDDVMASIVK